MKPKDFVSIIILFAILTFYGCKPLYVPNVINTPLFSNKGEFQAAAHFGTAGFDPQLAYAISNNIGIMGNGSFEIFEEDETDLVYPHKHSFGELGLGYYTKLAGKQRFEVYGGYGIGNIKYEDYDPNTNITIEAKVNTNRFFIQPAYGITSKNFDFSVASRVILVSGEGSVQKYTRGFWEPAVTLRAGGPNLKGVAQVGLSFPFDEDNYIDYEPLLFSIGIQGSFGKIFD